MTWNEKKRDVIVYQKKPCLPHRCPAPSNRRNIIILIISVKDMLSLLLLSSCSSFSVYLHFPFLPVLFNLYFILFILFHFTVFSTARLLCLFYFGFGFVVFVVYLTCIQEKWNSLANNPEALNSDLLPHKLYKKVPYQNEMHRLQKVYPGRIKQFFFSHPWP